MRSNPKDWYVFGNRHVPEDPYATLSRLLINRRRIVCLSPGSAAGINLLESIRACANEGRFVMPDYLVGVSIGAFMSAAIATSFSLDIMSASYPETLRKVISLSRVMRWRTPMDMGVLETVILHKILGLWISNLQKFKKDLDTNECRWIVNSKEDQWDTIVAQTPEVFVIVTEAQTGIQHVCMLWLKEIVRAVQYGRDDAMEHLLHIAVQKIKASMSLPAPISNPVYIRGASDLEDGWYLDGALGKSPFPIDDMRSAVIATDPTAIDYPIQVVCARPLVTHPAWVTNTLGPFLMRRAGVRESIIQATVEIDKRMQELPDIMDRLPVPALAMVPGAGREEISTHKITSEQAKSAARFAQRLAQHRL